MNDLGILLSGKFDIGKTVAELNKDLQKIASQVHKLDLGIDTGKLQQSVNREVDKVNRTSKQGVKIDADLTGMTKDFTDVNKAVDNLKKNFGATTATVRREVDVAAGATKSWMVTLQKAGEATRKIRLNPFDNEQGFKATDMTIIDDKEIQNLKLAEEMGKKREQSMARQRAEQERLAKAQADAANRNMENARKESAAEKKRRDDLQHAIQLEQQRAQTRRMGLERRFGRVLSSDQIKALDDYVNSMNRITVDTPNARREIDNLNAGFGRLQESVNSSKSRVSQFGDNLREALVRVPVWMIGMTAFYAPIRGLRNAVDQIIMLDTQMTELRRVMDATPQTYNSLMKESIQLSQELGNVVEDVNQAMIGFARQGYDPDTLVDLTGTATIASNISELDAEEAMSSITAALQAYKLEASESIGVIDRLNEVDNNFAIDTQTLAQAMQKSASVANIYSISMDELLGMISAIGITTRESGQIVGNSLKTLFTRLTTMDESIAALNSVGVEVKDMNGEVRSGTDILGDLAGRWQELSAEQQQNIGVTVAGRFQVSRFMTLMEQWDTAINVTNTSLNSQGSAMREQEEYSQSLEARLNRLKNSGIALAQSMGDALITDSIVAFTESVSKLADMSSSVIRTFGLLSPTFMLLGGAIGVINPKLRTMSQALLFGTTHMDKAKLSAAGLSTNLTRAGVATTVLKRGLRGLASATVVGVVFAGIGFGLEKLIGHIGDYINKQEELKKANEASIESLNNERDAIDELVKEYENLSNTNRNNEQEERYVQLQNELAQILPAVKIGEDDKGNAIIANSDIIKEQISLLEEKAALEHASTLRTANERLPSISDDLADENERMRKYKDEHEEIYNQLLEVYERSPDLKNMTDLELDIRSLTIGGFDTSLAANLRNSLDNAATEFDEAKESIRESRDELHEIIKSIAYDIGADVSGVDIAWIGDLSDGFDDLSKNDLSGLINRVGELKNSLGDVDIPLSNLNFGQFQLLESITKDVSNSASIGADQWGIYGEQLKSALDDADHASQIIGQLRYTEDELAKSAREAGVELSTHKPIFDDLGETINWVTNEAYANAMANGEIEDSLEGIGDEVDELAKKYNDTVSTIEGLNGMLGELSEEGELSAKSIGTIIEKHSEFLPYLDDEVRLRELIQDTIEEEGKVATEVVQQKLMNSENYFQSEEVMNSGFYNWLGKVYEGDLSNFKTLAQAKEAVENQLISSLSKKWGEFYRINSEGLVEMQNPRGVFPDSTPFGISDWALDKASDLRQEVLETNIQLKSMQTQFDNISLGNTDFSNISANIKNAGSAAKRAGDAAKKAGKDTKKAGKNTKDATTEVEKARFIADEYARSLEKVDLALAKLESTQKRQAKNSKAYRKSLRDEINLLSRKKDLIEAENKALQQQVKQGVVTQTGVVKTTKATGSSNQAKIWNFLKSKGFTDNVAAGIMGNFQLESNFNPKAVNHIGATGIAQWLGPRKRALQNFANARGTSIKNLQTQLDFLWKELNSTEKRTLNYLNANRNASAATIADQFDRLFERSERYPSHIRKRQQYANQALKKFGGTGGGGTQAIVDGSSEIAQSAQDIHNAESKIISNQQEILSLENKIQDLHLDIVHDRIDQYTRQGDMLDDQIAREEYYQGKVYETTSAYRNRLRSIVKLKREQRDYMDDAIAYTENQIKSNKTLSADQKQQLRDRVKDLKVTRLDMMSEISRLNVEISQSLIDAVYKKHEEPIAELSYQFSRHEKILERTRQGTERYSRTLSEQSDRLRENADLVFKQRQALMKVMKQNDLTYEQTKQIRDSLDELSLTYQDLQNQIIDVEWSRMTDLITRHDDAIHDLTYQLERNQKILARLEENTEEYIDLNDEIIRQTKVHAEMILAKRQAMMAEMKLLPNNSKKHKELRDELDALSHAYQDLLTSIHDMEEAMKESNKSIADDIISTMKDAYEKQKEIALAELDDIVEAEKDAHDDKMDRYDEDLKAYEKSINQKIDAIDRLHDKETYDKDVKKRNKEIAELQEEIDLLALDNSYAAQAERARLEEELAEKKEDLAEFQNDRDVHLRKQNLRDQLDDYKEHIEDEKEIERESFKKSQEARDKERRDIERHYNEIIKNERRWAEIHKSIVEGNVDETKEMMQEFLDDFGKMNADIAEEIGISWQEVLNMIDAVNDAMDDMGGITTTPENSTRKKYEISTNSFETEAEAQRVANALRRDYDAQDVRVSNVDGMWRAYGSFDDEATAQKILDRLVEIGRITSGQINAPLEHGSSEALHEIKTMAYRTKAEAEHIAHVMERDYGATGAHASFRDGKWRAYGNFKDADTAQRVLDRMIELGRTDYGAINDITRNIDPVEIKTMAYRTQAEAERIANAMERDYGATQTEVVFEDGSWRAYGRFDNREVADQILQRLIEQGRTDYGRVLDSDETHTNRHQLQTDAFNTRERAETIARRLERDYAGTNTRIVSDGSGFRVQGFFSDADTAQKVLARMRELGYISPDSPDHVIDEDDSSMYRLKTNEFDNREDADRAASALDKYYGAKATRTQSLGGGRYQAIGTFDNLETAERVLRRLIERGFYATGGEIEKFHQGGIIGATGGKLSQLANKLFNAKPNEQIVKSLRGELQIPPQNIANGFKNIGNLIGSLGSPVVSDSGITINRMEVNIDSIDGGEDGARQMFKYIDREMTRKGRNR